jgi:Tfp pilus assembly protein PilF
VSRTDLRGALALGALSLGLAACDLEIGRPRLDPALERRLAERQAAVRARPDDLQAALSLAEGQLEAKQLFAAAEGFRAAATRDPSSARAHAGQFLTYLELGYIEAGIEAMKACFQLDREQPDCLYGFGALMELDGSERALREGRFVWHRLLEVAPDHRKAAYVRSALEQLDARLGPQAPRAAPTAEEAPAQPADPHAGVPGAAALPGHGAGDGQPVGQLNPFGQAIAKAIEAVKANDAPRAEAAFREALAARPDDPGALAGLAESMFAQGRQPDALATIQKAYQLDPKDAQVRWAFGLIMLRNRQRTAEAIAAWESLVAEDPEYAAQLRIPELLEGHRKAGAPR